MSDIRLIDANALKEKLSNEWFVEPNATLFKWVFDLIDNAPTVEPIKQCKFCKHCGNEDYCSNCHSDHSLFEYYERPQGEWIDYDNTFYKCPDCGYLLEKHCPQCQSKVILPKGGDT